MKSNLQTPPNVNDFTYYFITWKRFGAFGKFSHQNFDSIVANCCYFQRDNSLYLFYFYFINFEFWIIFIWYCNFCVFWLLSDDSYDIALLYENLSSALCKNLSSVPLSVAPLADTMHCYMQLLKQCDSTWS